MQHVNNSSAAVCQHPNWLSTLSSPKRSFTRTYLVNGVYDNLIRVPGHIIYLGNTRLRIFSTKISETPTSNTSNGDATARFFNHWLSVWGQQTNHRAPFSYTFNCLKTVLSNHFSYNAGIYCSICYSNASIAYISLSYSDYISNHNNMYFWIVSLELCNWSHSQ